MKKIEKILFWGCVICLMAVQFMMRLRPIYQTWQINDISGRPTWQLGPGDVLEQTFFLQKDNLESVAIAICYEDSARDTGRLTVRFFHEGSLAVEQPLLLAACPEGTFMEFWLGLEKCQGDELRIQIVNDCDGKEGVFSILSTADIAKYQEYSEGYLFNGKKAADGSILCSLRFRMGYQFYEGLSGAFVIFSGAYVFQHFAVRALARMRLRKSH